MYLKKIGCRRLLDSTVSVNGLKVKHTIFCIKGTFFFFANTLTSSFSNQLTIKWTDSLCKSLIDSFIYQLTFLLRFIDFCCSPSQKLNIIQSFDHQAPTFLMFPVCVDMTNVKWKCSYVTLLSWIVINIWNKQIYLRILVPMSNLAEQFVMMFSRVTKSQHWTLQCWHHPRK